MNKGILIGAVVFILFIISAFVYFSYKPSEKAQSPEEIKSKIDERISPQQKTAVKIMINNSQFSPDSITINKGQIVEFRNMDKVAHIIKFSNPIIKAFSTLRTGMAYSVNLTSTGDYEYHCEIHPEMKGTIIVQ